MNGDLKGFNACNSAYLAIYNELAISAAIKHPPDLSAVAVAMVGSLGVFEDAGLDGLVFPGLGHGYQSGNGARAFLPVIPTTGGLENPPSFVRLPRGTRLSSRWPWRIRGSGLGRFCVLRD